MAEPGGSRIVLNNPKNTSSPTVSLKQETQRQRPRLHAKPGPQGNPKLPPPQQRQLTSIEAQIRKSVGQLDDLASAIQKFKYRFDELTSHLNFIQQSIDTRTSNPAASPSPKADTNNNKNNQTETTLSSGNVSRTTQWVEPELETLCKKTQGKALRRYIINRLSDFRKLGEELPLAIRAAPNPARLVLDCVGRFFLQGSKAYAKDHRMVKTRCACVLALESLLLAFQEEIKMDEKVRKEAEEAEEGAVSWRKRLISEGGLGGASAMDARGLLLLIGCYGIPRVFRHDDVWDLVRVSKTKRAALRRSRALVSSVTDILERMMRNEMKIEALDVVSAFGIEDKFPPKMILESFLWGCDEAVNRSRREAKDNLSLQKEANEKQLAILKSAMKFIEDRQLDDPMKLPLKEMIIKLDKENFPVRKKIYDQVAKRTAYVNEDENKLIQETKRPRFASKDSPVMSLPRTGLHEHAAANHVPCNGSTQTNMLDAGPSHPIGDYPAAEPGMNGSHPSTGYPAAESAMYTGSLCETALHERRATDHLDFKISYSCPANEHSTSETTLHGSGDVYLSGTAPGKMAGGGSPMQSMAVGPSTVHDSPSTGSLGGIRREMKVDRTEQMMGSNGQLNEWSGASDATHDNTSPGQSSVGQLASGLFGPSTSIESFVGFPQSPPSGAATWTAVDLYRFVDAVVEIEYGSASNKSGSSPLASGTQHASYVY